jgi:hypothetical protein
MKIKIKNVFSIGYRCNTDDFLKMLKIRNYSSPFSYMVIDFKTSIYFIINKFNNFHNIYYINNKEDKYYKWYGNNWNHDLFFNKIFLQDKLIKNVNEWDRICVWNHHNLTDSNTIKSMKCRINRFLWINTNLIKLC